jgi:hypothetical protein
MRGMRRGALLCLAGLLAAALPMRAAGPRTPKVPGVEIVATARVESAPRRTDRKKGRKLLELEVMILAYVLSPDQPRDADRSVPIDMSGRVKVVHDLSCGENLALSPGDRVELKGEYVKAAGGGDLILYTHAAEKGCGPGEGHPAGYFRKAVPATPTAKPVSPRPADLVPAQPFVGTPAAGEKSYAEILRLKEAGASEETLLEKIRQGKTRYSLTTIDIQKLRDAGFSSQLIEAMLQSGRGPVTPAPSPVPTAR